MKIKDKQYLKEARELFFGFYEELPNYLDNIDDVKKHKVFMDLRAAQYFLARYSYKLGIITNFELALLRMKRMK